MPTDEPLEVGSFAAWLHGFEEALAGDRASDVPCGSCTACCRASQFVHIGPDETDTLAHIPAALLFPAPRLPAGHVLMGYDEQGACPMLEDTGCSIYEHRPRTCRTYDCRVFPATGVEVSEPGQAAVAEQASRWRFASSTEADRTALAAVRAAARFVRDQAETVPDEIRPVTSAQHAVLAVRVHRAFLDGARPDVGALLGQLGAASDATGPGRGRRDDGRMRG